MSSSSLSVAAQRAAYQAGRNSTVPAATVATPSSKLTHNGTANYLKVHWHKRILYLGERGDAQGLADFLQKYGDKFDSTDGLTFLHGVVMVQNNYLKNGLNKHSTVRANYSKKLNEQGELGKKLFGQGVSKRYTEDPEGQDLKSVIESGNEAKFDATKSSSQSTESKIMSESGLENGSGNLEPNASSSHAQNQLRRPNLQDYLTPTTSPSPSVTVPTVVSNNTSNQGLIALRPEVLEKVVQNILTCPTFLNDNDMGRYFGTACAYFVRLRLDHEKFPKIKDLYIAKEKREGNVKYNNIGNANSVNSTQNCPTLTDPSEILKLKNFYKKTVSQWRSRNLGMMCWAYGRGKFIDIDFLLAVCEDMIGSVDSSMATLNKSSQDFNPNQDFKSQSQFTEREKLISEASRNAISKTAQTLIDDNHNDSNHNDSNSRNKSNTDSDIFPNPDSLSKYYTIRSLSTVAWSLATLLPEIRKLAGRNGGLNGNDKANFVDDSLRNDIRRNDKRRDWFESPVVWKEKQLRNSMRSGSLSGMNNGNLKVDVAQLEDLESTVTKAMTCIAQRLTESLEALLKKKIKMENRGKVNERAMDFISESAMSASSSDSNQNHTAKSLRYQESLEEDFWTEQDISNSTWAYVNFPHCHTERELFYSFVSKTNPEFFSAQGMTQIFYSLARTNHKPSETALYGEKVVRELTKRLKSDPKNFFLNKSKGYDTVEEVERLTNRAASNIVWSIASCQKAGRQASYNNSNSNSNRDGESGSASDSRQTQDFEFAGAHEFFDLIGKHVDPENILDVVNLSWGFTTMKFESQAPFENLARRALEILDPSLGAAGESSHSHSSGSNNSRSNKPIACWNEQCLANLAFSFRNQRGVFSTRLKSYITSLIVKRMKEGYLEEFQTSMLNACGYQVTNKGEVVEMTVGGNAMNSSSTANGAASAQLGNRHYVNSSGQIVQKYKSSGPESKSKVENSNPDNSESTFSKIHQNSTPLILSDKEILFRMVKTIAMYTGSTNVNYLPDKYKPGGPKGKMISEKQGAVNSNATGLARRAPFRPATIVNTAQSTLNTELLELSLLDFLLRPNVWLPKERAKLRSLLEMAIAMDSDQGQFYSVFDGPVLPKNFKWLVMQGRQIL